LAAADVGIAMGSIGTAVAMETADVVLLKDDIGQVPYLIELSKATMVNIRTNIIVSMTIVFGSVAASAFGWFGPVIGAIMHEVAAVPVIANAATLIGWKSKKF
jgi:cation transport ATPase